MVLSDCTDLQLNDNAAGFESCHSLTYLMGKSMTLNSTESTKRLRSTFRSNEIWISTINNLIESRNNGS